MFLLLDKAGRSPNERNCPADLVDGHRCRRTERRNDQHREQDFEGKKNGRTFLMNQQLKKALEAFQAETAIPSIPECPVIRSERERRATAGGAMSPASIAGIEIMRVIRQFATEPLLPPILR